MSATSPGEVATEQGTATRVESPYLTIAESAGYTRLSINTIRALRRKGELPPSYGLPGRPVYRKADLDRWVLSRPQSVARRRKAGI